jgi:hypothetical protein
MARAWQDAGVSVSGAHLLRSALDHLRYEAELVTLCRFDSSPSEDHRHCFVVRNHARQTNHPPRSSEQPDFRLRQRKVRVVTANDHVARESGLETPTVRNAVHLPSMADRESSHGEGIEPVAWAAYAGCMCAAHRCDNWFNAGAVGQTSKASAAHDTLLTPLRLVTAVVGSTGL